MSRTGRAVVSSTMVSSAVEGLGNGQGAVFNFTLVGEGSSGYIKKTLVFVFCILFWGFCLFVFCFGVLSFLWVCLFVYSDGESLLGRRVAEVDRLLLVTGLIDAGEGALRAVLVNLPQMV